MRTLNTISDPTFKKDQQYGMLDRFFIRFIKDERDLPFVYLSLQITLLLLPFAIFLFTPTLTGGAWWAAVTVYWVLLVYFLGPFTLMLHNTSHRPFFKREYDWGNFYIPWVIGPFMGQSPETYFSHHIGMHHAENNLHDDKSSTMKYQRDSFRGFLHYFGVFLFIGVVELIDYFKSKNRKSFIVKIVRGEFSFVLFCVLLLFVNVKATLMIFVLPFVFVRFSMMAGNWGQHAFIDANDPANNYRNSITLINSVYNRRCFNDGYHIGHHLRPHMHWTDMANDFVKNKDKYATNKAIVFEGMDFQMVWFWLMLKRYDVLADKFVNINNVYQSKDEVIAFLKERTRRVEPNKVMSTKRSTVLG